MLLIAHGGQIAVFLNGRPLAYTQDDQLTGDQNSIGVSAEGDYEVTFDNVKFWKLEP